MTRYHRPASLLGLVSVDVASACSPGCSCCLLSTIRFEPHAHWEFLTVTRLVSGEWNIVTTSASRNVVNDDGCLGASCSSSRARHRSMVLMAFERSTWCASAAFGAEDMRSAIHGRVVHSAIGASNEQHRELATICGACHSPGCSTIRCASAS